MIAPALEDMGYDLVRVAVLGRGRLTVQIMADRQDGSLIKVKDCETISHAVGALMDVENPIPGAWDLEVSSPGIDRPLTRVKDWNRYVGHLAKVEMMSPLLTGDSAGRKRFSGFVVGADEENAVLRLEEGMEVALPMRDIGKARLVLTDALIKASAEQHAIKETIEDIEPETVADDVG